MRCPSCRQRAIGLLGWFAHILYQPVWKKNRYHTACRSCGAALVAQPGEELKGFMLSLLGAGLGLAVSSYLGGGALFWPPVLAGMVAGASLHYGMARYQLKDPGARPQLPDARQR